VDKENNIIGEDTFLKLRKQKEQMKAELEQVKIQRDIALRKQKKLEDVVKELRKIIES
jgi:DNA polymerase III epsilon subunit-like protein